jgi:hypothetical protein
MHQLHDTAVGATVQPAALTCAMLPVRAADIMQKTIQVVCRPAPGAGMQLDHALQSVAGQCGVQRTHQVLHNHAHDASRHTIVFAKQY